MTTQVWIQIAVIFGVLLYTQVGTKKINLFRFVLPVAIAGIYGVKYMTSIPTDGNNGTVLVLCALLGAVFGGLLIAATAIHQDGLGQFFTKAGAPYAIILVLSLCTRLGFVYYAQHYPESMGKFMYNNHIDPGIISTAFIVMMLVMLLVRLAGLLIRLNLLKKRNMSAIKVNSFMDGDH
ncbi:hypothetical protein [Paenibacillus sp. HW567]|uniref:hypothetical protein n=1 Tax=Paenibacillus sp. HW567 TaxID=1034769 RepID=UPI00037FC327|nr:hypothetical protein [Paenibacillus sp. HW567]